MVELVIFEQNFEIVERKAGDGKRDAQLVFTGAFDIVGGIAFGRRFGDALERALELVESEQ
jgi:carbamoylphosphate synthase large subunit